jgi:hypothetical protein
MPVKWTCKRDGASVEHSTSYRGFKLLVTNFPGSRTLWWEVLHGEKRWGREEDRFEHGVGSLKQRCIEKVDELLK